MAPKEIGDPVAGYFFTPPEGWLVEQREGRFVLGSPSANSLATVIPHTAAGLDELQPLFDLGWVEPGVELRPEGDVVVRDDGAAVQRLVGQVEGQEARGTMVASFSPEGGGVMVIGVSPAGSSDPILASAVEDIAGSVRYTTPDTGALVESWDALVRGKKLTYLSSYSSSGPAVEGMMTGGGYSERHEIVLNADGSFDASGDFSVSVDVGGGGVGQAERLGPSGGTWRILVAAGQALLELHRGEASDTYVLTRFDGEVHLNGRRYFVTEP